MSRRVDAAVHGDQPTGPQAVLDRAAPHARGEQLPAAHEPVLARREPGDHGVGVDAGAFCRHVLSKAPAWRDSPLAEPTWSRLPWMPMQTRPVARGPRQDPASKLPSVAEHHTAVIDMGSNSFRLVVFTAARGWWKRTDEIHLAVRIGEGLDASGKLGGKPMKRALEAAEVFAHFCAASGIPQSSVQPVATSAIRDASNQQVFLDRARERTGLEVRVLSRAPR